MIVDERKGSVLGRGMIMKSDHYMDEKIDKLSQDQVKLLGGPNFRKTDINICSTHICYYAQMLRFYFIFFK